ncbi:MAG TPA: cytochrome c oxidase assembly protein, partial [Gaiellales bacterium]|nr:cytochrome c oxidase assembly protein [Gaiellales bacterium]
MVSFDPAGIALVALMLALYGRAVTVLRWRGYRVPRAQQAFWYSGTALIAIALLGPPDALSDDLLSAHMAQHLLLADIAAPLLLVGMRSPVLQFMLPRPVLVPLARTQWLRRLFRFLRRPLVAVPVWVVVLYTWHFGFAFEGALRNPWVHALQHQMFFLASLLVWWSIVEPKRRRTSGELWKAGHLIGMRIAGMFLGMAFILMRVQAYPWYGDRAHAHGLGVLPDQQIGGGLMFLVDLLVMLFGLAFFFWRAAADSDRAEERQRELA